MRLPAFFPLRRLSLALGLLVLLAPMAPREAWAKGGRAGKAKKPWTQRLPGKNQNKSKKPGKAIKRLERRLEASRSKPTSYQEIRQSVRAKLPAFEDVVVSHVQGTLTAYGINGDVKTKLGEAYIIPRVGESLRVYDIKVKKPYRGKGLQSLIFARVLEEYPTTKELSSKGGFFGTNREQFSLAILRELAPKSKRSGDPSKQLQSCCTKMINRMSKSERNALFERAIKAMPAYKTRARFGFTHVRDMDVYIGKDDMEINFYATRE